MMICNYNVSKENSGALFFDENFCMAEFSMHFDLERNFESPFGHLDFKPEQHVATLFYYGSAEDLTPMIDTYDLHDFDSECGDGVINALHSYNLSALYHCAEKFTYKVLTNLMLEFERIDKERV